MSERKGRLSFTPMPAQQQAQPPLTFQIPRKCLEQIQAHALAEYPNMACGIIITGDGNDLVRPCTNIQNKLHAEDPVRDPEDARTVFTMADEDIDKIQKERYNGWEVKACYYSQDAQTSTISKLSQNMLKGWDLWLFPGISLFILSIQNRNVVDTAAYKWDEKRQDSIQLEVEIRDK